MIDKAEEIFEPKRILSSMDWLADIKEPGDEYAKYASNATSYF